MRESSYTFKSSYESSRLTCTIYNLLDEGIYGNEHMLFQDLNNDVIADHVEDWIKDKLIILFLLNILYMLYFYYYYCFKVFIFIDYIYFKSLNDIRNNNI